jgi:hypothetical protein
MASIAMYAEQPACTPTRFSMDTGTLAGYAITAYAASSYLSLGDSTQAERHARATLAVHEPRRRTRSAATFRASSRALGVRGGASRGRCGPPGTPTPTDGGRSVPSSRPRPAP